MSAEEACEEFDWIFKEVYEEELTPDEKSSRLRLSGGLIEEEKHLG
jgi:hypothetical protein